MSTAKNDPLPKPQYITNIKNIHPELKKIPQWVCFNFQRVSGRWTKIPFQTNGRKASSTNLQTWTSFNAVELHACCLEQADGVGFVFTTNDPYCGIDLDKCIDPLSKKIAPWAEKWVQLFAGTYMEISPSGTGIKIFTKAKLPFHGRKKAGIEIYDKERFFTVTGHAYGTSLPEIPNQQKLVDQLLSEIFTDASDLRINKVAPLVGEKLSDAATLKLIETARNAKNGEKFSKLFRGDFEAYHKSRSEADLSLCSMLAFYTACNEVAMDQIFRKSDLYRNKWERLDYAAGTIRKAIQFHQKGSIEKDFSDKLNVSSEDTHAFPIIHISDIEETNVEFQIEELWPLNSVGIISGQPGICKTWFSEELILSISAGIKAFGKFAAKKGMVLAFNAEDDPARITKQRIKGFCRAHKIDIKTIDFHLIKVPSIDLGTVETQERLRNTIAKHKPALIVLDPLRNIHSLDEDNASKMAPLLRFLRELNREFECSILLVCHDKKPSKEGQRRASQTRGSNALEGWRDSAFYLDEVDSVNKITQVQLYHRGAPAISPFLIKLNVSVNENKKIESANLEIIDRAAILQVKEDALGKQIEDLLKNGERMTRNQIRKRLGVQNNPCRESIRSLIDLGRLKEIKEGRRIFISYSVQDSTSTK